MTEKHPGGRPSLYKPEYCQVAEDYLALGYSMAALAGEIGVARSTIFEWIDNFPEFSDAIKTGQAKSARWWENHLRTIVSGKSKGNVTAAIFGLKNRAREDWSDRVEHTGKDGAPMTVVVASELGGLG